MPKILHVGLRAQEGMIHCPLIQIKPLPVDWEESLSKTSHLLFTSQTALELMQVVPQEPLIAVGRKTFAAAKRLGFNAQYVAEDETQEGVVALLEKIRPESLFWPRSARARGVIKKFCDEAQIPLIELPLYDVEERLTPLPDLERVDEVYFTSPSTVNVFFKRVPKPPQHLKFRAIGEVTSLALERQIG